MTKMRKGDTEPHSRFRENRFFHSMEEWYFVTREGTVEGPYEHRAAAEENLEIYLRNVNKTVN